MHFGMWPILLAAALSAWPIYDRQSEIDAGRRVYDAHKCATCHMVAGKGNIRYPLDGVAAKLSATDLRRWLTDTAEMEGALPRQPAVRMSEWMDANRKINDRDLDALVAYLRSLK
jgi:mono/diheme cytochrome c family protein